ncbi:glycoside hydrolase superfamily [Cadophora sp. MPI-SDFR-AT-0126]|nr:glycoside hydrolase superfamily [Leotiomycetes sp. MPI-SDFR-AT-0126]
MLCLSPFLRSLLILVLFTLSSAELNRQDLVTWDQYSISVRGERVLFLSGEFHPFRLPSPGLWLDVFQKIRALGYSGVSFYLMWGLLEGAPGHFQSNGVFDLQEFFDAATQAGIYLLARPGPYINSEVSGGGYPGWLQRIEGNVRSSNPSFLNATANYISKIGKIISEAQITNGGPVILFQPENEYSFCSPYTSITDISACLDKTFMASVEKQWRDSGITVPFVNNDAFSIGNFAPGTGPGAVDIYGFDSYPMGWGSGCQDPYNWTRLLDPLSIYNSTTHRKLSPTTPFSIIEYQGGSAENWGGSGNGTCAAMINHEFARIFYKVNFGFRTTIMNLYMMFGGTNWGNLGHPGGYTSYDVGAAISEDRLLTREKYSEIKLQAQFQQASPAFMTSQAFDSSFEYTNTSRLVTTLLRGASTNFYTVRHFDYGSHDSTPYMLYVETSIGNLTLPRLGGTLMLNGRDAKVHITDYDMAGVTLIYSTAEIYTWQRVGRKVILIMYGGEGEIHEFAVSLRSDHLMKIKGLGITHQTIDDVGTFQWKVERRRRIISFDDELEVHLLWRNDAYNYWVLDLPLPQPLGLHVSPSRSSSSVIIRGGYLLRNATISDQTLFLNGDLNATTEVEVVAAPAGCCSALAFNGNIINTRVKEGRLSGTLKYKAPKIHLPRLSSLEWKYIDSLPELEHSYNDSSWVLCDHETSNSARNLTTPTSLYASDYGYHSGSILYRGHFVANGEETSFSLSSQGGFAYAHSVWLNSAFLGSWAGNSAMASYNQTFNLTEQLVLGTPYVFTILVDHMGLDQQFAVNRPTMKSPRGILDYSLSGHESKSDIVWKITGNFEGEKRRDLSRGPLNEGSTFAERQGFHLPGTPINKWASRSPLEGLPGPGVGFYATTFNLDYPPGYDIPTSVVFTNSSAAGDPAGSAVFRIQLFVNGWQFGKYVNNIGPQTEYPIPEGILNHHGENFLALTFWSLQSEGAKLDCLKLKNNAVVKTGYAAPRSVLGENYLPREGSY